MASEGVRQRLTGLIAIVPEDLRGAMVGVKTEEMLRGGAVAVWHRPNEPGDDSDARVVRGLCGGFGVPYIVRSDLEVAEAVAAEGLLLEDGAIDVETGRKLLGKEALVGVACGETLDRAIRAQQMGADYVAFSFGESAAPPIPFLEMARRELGVPIIVVADPLSVEAAAQLIRSGVDGIGVRDVYAADHPRRAVETLARLFDRR